MRSAPGTALLCTALAVALAGCTSSEAGTPRPTEAPGTSSPTTTATTSSEPSAPRVTDPLDASRFVGNPCGVLTAAQLTQFNTTETGEKDTEGAIGSQAPSCSWSSDHEPISWMLSVSFYKGNENGLDNFYGNAETRWKGYFQPVTVDGYPGVFAAGVDGRPVGGCALTIGVSDSLAVGLQIEGGKRLGMSSCGEAEKLASAVITTLKGA